jgi:transcription-repair coupling factor (superfamily II helicase)
VIHSDHGMGRLVGLKTLDAGSATDTIEIEYQDGHLLVPVSEIGLLFRYGAGGDLQLDRLRTKSWGTKRRAAIRKIDEAARQLIGLAASRAQSTAPILKVERGAYRKFCNGFEYEATPDQAKAFADVEKALAKSTSMDRIVCGDVGSGKTEVAMRAAFIGASAGFQVAVAVPSTLLARQHAERFRERFKAFRIDVFEASRLIKASEFDALKTRISGDRPAIVIGTHALLDDEFKWGKLGLVIVDEEHRFGVDHKEKLKRLTNNVHVLSLSATPIPRTLQMALASVRDLSLIGTLPAGRRPVTTTIIPLSGRKIAEALRAERKRGGKSFFVCPKVADLAKARDFIAREAPELRIITAHGGTPTAELKDVVEKFSSRKFDVLVCTTIVESGLDVASANTIIVYDAHRLGLAQLYQLRGRVGRSKQRAQAFFVIPNDAELTPEASRRIDALKTLNSAGAGFAVACEDLDIRGAGTIAGDEQSGHIKELGIELFQTLLKRAVEAIRSGSSADWADIWVPRLSLGIETHIPHDYIADESSRLDLYSRLARARDEEEISRSQGQIVRKYGELPRCVANVFDLARLRCRCTLGGIDNVTVGPRGGVVHLHGGISPSVLRSIADRVLGAKLKKGELIIKAQLRTAEEKISWVAQLVSSLVVARDAAQKEVAASKGATDRRPHETEKQGSSTGMNASVVTPKVHSNSTRRRGNPAIAQAPSDGRTKLTGPQRSAAAIASS